MNNGINLREYEVLFRIENVLREFIIRDLQSYVGSYQELKKRFPSDQGIEGTIARGKEADRLKNWWDSSKYHPLYYMNLTQLIDTILKRDNWSEVFQKKFNPIKNPDFSAVSAKCYPIRNRIAHSRPCYEDDLEKLNELQKMVIHAVGGEETYEDLFDHSTEITDAKARIRDFYHAICDACEAIQDVNRIDEEKLDSIHLVATSEWLLEGLVSDQELNSISVLMDLVFEYSRLPTGEGSAENRQKWEKREDVSKLSLTLSAVSEVIGDREDS